MLFAEERLVCHGNLLLSRRMLYEFYGETCPHCVAMKPIVEELEKELGVTVTKLEVWNSEENAQKLIEADCERCGGVPFFWNDETNTFICGGTDKETLRAWMRGK